MLPFEGGKLAVRFQRYAALGDNILKEQVACAATHPDVLPRK